MQSVQATGWQGGRSFAVVRCSSSDSREKKQRSRRTKEERKSMVESFIKKYQKVNDGKFPSLNLTHKEVGGSFYTVREIVREIIQENRVLGPGNSTSKAINLESIPGELAEQSLSEDISTILSISTINHAVDPVQEESLFLSNEQKTTHTGIIEVDDSVNKECPEGVSDEVLDGEHYLEILNGANVDGKLENLNHLGSDLSKLPEEIEGNPVAFEQTHTEAQASEVDLTVPSCEDVSMTHSQFDTVVNFDDQGNGLSPRINSSVASNSVPLSDNLSTYTVSLDSVPLHVSSDREDKPVASAGAKVCISGESQKVLDMIHSKEIEENPVACEQTHTEAEALEVDLTVTLCKDVPMTPSHFDTAVNLDDQGNGMSTRVKSSVASNSVPLLDNLSTHKISLDPVPLHASSGREDKPVASAGAKDCISGVSQKVLGMRSSLEVTKNSSSHEVSLTDVQLEKDSAISVSETAEASSTTVVDEVSTISPGKQLLLEKASMKDWSETIETPSAIAVNAVPHESINGSASQSLDPLASESTSTAPLQRPDVKDIHSWSSDPGSKESYQHHCILKNNGSGGHPGSMPEEVNKSENFGMNPILVAIKSVLTAIIKFWAED